MRSAIVNVRNMRMIHIQSSNYKEAGMDANEAIILQVHDSN